MQSRNHSSHGLCVHSFAARIAALVLLLTAAALWPALGQTLENDRRRGVEILEEIKKDIRKNYYDVGFRGIDLDVHFKAAEEKVKQAASIGEALGIIARSLMDFGDSHTYFVIPAPADQVEQGWEMQMIGDKAYVIAVKPGSAAEAKDFKPGDEIIMLAGSKPTRENLSKLWYFLQYQPSIFVVAQRAGREPRQLEIPARIVKGKAVHNLASVTGNDRADLIRQAETEARLHRHRYIESDELLIWKMPAFDLADSQVDDLMEKARKRKALILDLRGNGGGLEKMLLRLTGHVFDQDVKIGDLKSRTGSKPLTAKTSGNRGFKGKLIVLVDSQSGSAAEVFARLVQLEKRGTVIGDRTSGYVMRGAMYNHKSGMDRIFYYGVVVTIADLIMTDGKSLEKTGMSPDETILPTAADIEALRDPALARAAELAGFTITPEKAGALFPIEWRQ